jgi:hypothetical protein
LADCISSSTTVASKENFLNSTNLFFNGISSNDSSL